MLYGFLGFEPTPGGFKIHPRLPKDWPEVKFTRLHLHDMVMDLTVKANGTIALRTDHPAASPMVVELRKGSWQCGGADRAEVERDSTGLSAEAGLCFSIKRSRSGNSSSAI